MAWLILYFFQIIYIYYIPAIMLLFLEFFKEPYNYLKILYLNSYMVCVITILTKTIRIYTRTILTVLYLYIYVFLYNPLGLFLLYLLDTISIL
jgi:hypothetical protein